MHTTLQKILDRPPAWLGESARTAPDRAVAISTRVRLARNLCDVPFPGRAEQAARRRVWDKVSSLAGDLLEATTPLETRMVDLGPSERDALFERRLASRELCSHGVGSGVLIREDERVAVLVNEEDHVRIQVLVPGLQLNEALRCSERVDDALCRGASVAFSGELGFLTACPTNLGTGMRASVMLHLPGLVLTDRMESAVRAVGELGLAVRGTYGEGSEAIGHFFQVSNQSTLGESENEILDRLNRLVRDLAWHEENARLHLVRHQRAQICDYVGRAYGVLRHAYRVSGRESLEHLAALRLGCLLGMFRSLTVEAVGDLMLRTRPGHLQLRANREMNERERDEFRASLIRSVLAPEKIHPK